MQAVAVMLVTEKGKGAQSNELEVHQKGARVLKEKGVVRRVVIRRAGSQHVPLFSDEENRAAFDAFTADMPRTAAWDGQSPRVEVDGDPAAAMDASRLLQVLRRTLCSC